MEKISGAKVLTFVGLAASVLGCREVSKIASPQADDSLSNQSLNRKRIENNLAEAIPDLSDVASVQTHLVPGSTRLTIHIKLVHGGDDLNPKIKELTSQTADRIEAIVKRIGEKLAVTALYVDGMTSETAKSITDLCTQYPNARKIIDMYDGARVKRSKEEVDAAIGEIAGRIPDYRKAIETYEHRMKYDAAFRLAVQGFELRGAEDEVLHKAARIEAEANDFGGKTKDYMEKREDYLLNLISSDKEPVHIVIFGAYHDFTNNVSSFNDAHPSDQHSLIVITPNTIPEDREALLKLLDSLDPKR